MNDFYFGKSAGDKCHLIKFTKRLKLKTDFQYFDDTKLIAICKLFTVGKFRKNNDGSFKKTCF